MTPTSIHEPGCWWVYILLCRGDKLYVGIAKDVDARFEVHRARRGAFYTRLNEPIGILAREPHSSRSEALKAEYALKQLSTEQKRAWIAQRT